MVLKTTARRVLAIDLRPRSFGFVVFEGRDELLDWGIRLLRDASGHKILPGSRLAPLLREFQPTIVLLKSTVWDQDSLSLHRESLLDTIRRESDDRTSVRLISPQQIRRIFPEAHNKDDLAEQVSKRFPDLAWKLPPRRKVWQREHYRMSIFDAAAFAVAYFAARADERDTAA